MKRVFAVVLLIVAGLPFVALEPAAALPGGFQISNVFTGLDTPTSLRFASDGRVFVAEKSGLIKVFDDVGDTTPAIFANLSTNVYNHFDRGLLGIELHPSFPSTPYVYALYSHDADIGGTAPKWGTPGVLSDPCPDPPGDTTDGCVASARLTRLEASGNNMIGSEHVLVEDWCQQFPSHSIGTVTFGPDGALYVGGGDGALNLDWGHRGDPVNPCGDPPGGVGGAMIPPFAEGGTLRSQDLRTAGDPVTLDGSIIRVDPGTGEPLPDNPLIGNADPMARRIIAYGVRNPFRFTFRPGTNDIYLADVGASRYEEINIIPEPSDAVVENFGWPCYEGSPRNGTYDSRDFTICEQMYGTPATTGPWFAYQHGLSLEANDSCDPGGGVISAIEFYEGGSYPAAYDGALFFADYSRGCIWVMFKHTNGELDRGSVQSFAENNVGYPVDLQVGPDGDIFYVDIGFGRIRRIRHFSTNQPPEAAAAATPTAGPIPLNVAFDGTGSSDPEGGSLTFEWDLDGDGAFDDSTAPQPSHIYTEAGDYTVRLRVTDPEGASDTDSIVISPGNGPPAATILQPGSDFTWHVGETITFSGAASDPEEGALPDSALSWSMILHHCPENICHAHPVQDYVGQAGGSFSAPDHEYPVHLELRLTATDSHGLTSTDSVLLFPETVNLTADSVPQGLELGLGAITAATPFTETFVVGSATSVTAPSPQSLAGSPYQFLSWSDGGARTHEFVAPSTPATIVATYEPDDLLDVGITDSGYNPKSIVDSPFPVNVRWTNNGTRNHTVTDSSGMGLYDSGVLAPGGRFALEFYAAGRYAYRSTVDNNMTGSVQVVPAASPAAGTSSTRFDITWASRTAPAGYVYDVQILRPGSTSWTNWRTGQSATTAAFVPIENGTYEFRSRLRRTSNGRSSAYSASALILVEDPVVNQPPTAVISATPTDGLAPLTVQFDGTGSSDPESGALGYEWDLDGDGAYDDSTEAQPAHTYDDPQDYTVRLRVTDPEGATDTDSIVISAANASPAATILAPGTDLTWQVGEAIDFSGAASDPEDGELPESALSWSMILHHCLGDTCHTHPVQDFVGQASGTFSAPDHAYPAHLEVLLTATDSGGLTATSSVLIYPETVQVTADSVPEGLQLRLGPTTARTPFTETFIVGSSSSVAAPSPQTLAGLAYRFLDWSDGGTQTHNFVAPATPATFVATYAVDDVKSVSITDSGFDPKNVADIPFPTTVLWTNSGTRGHSATDDSGMGLYDSGVLTPGSGFSFEFFAAGRYPYRSTVDSGMSASIQIPMTVSPTSGATSTSFDVAWASRPAPPGYVYDVQILRPGSSWTNWRYATTAAFDSFVPASGTGTYQFRSRLRRTSNGRSCAYTAPMSVTVL